MKHSLAVLMNHLICREQQRFRMASCCHHGPLAERGDDLAPAIDLAQRDLEARHKAEE